MPLSLVCKEWVDGPILKYNSGEIFERTVCLNLATRGTWAGHLNSEKLILSVDLVAKLNIFWDVLWFEIRAMAMK